MPHPHPKIRKAQKDYSDGDGNISPLTSTTPHIEEKLVRDENTHELYHPIISTVVLKHKKEILYVPLEFNKNLTIDALEDSRAYVSAIAQNEVDTIKQEARNSIFKIDDFTHFQIQVANFQLEKPLATGTLQFDLGDNTFDEHNCRVGETDKPNHRVALFEEEQRRH